MSTDTASAEPRPERRGRGARPSRTPWLLLLAMGGLGLFVGRMMGDPAPSSEPDVIVVAPTPDVVVALRELARLEGMVVYVERVIDLRERQSAFFDLFSGEDAILLVASGEVTAGVDLRALSVGAVEADLEAKRASIVLPRATISSLRLDNDRTYVHTRKTDLFAVRRADLETRARREAERTLERAALEAGILEKAEASVERTVEGLLRSLGFERVEVRFEDGTSGEATAVGAPI
jgi:hypothetical protein